MTIDPNDAERGAASSPYEHISRRRMVAAGAATWASISLAGCSGPGDDGGDGDGGDDGDGGTPTETVTVTSTTTTTETVTEPSETSDGGDGGDGSGGTATLSPTASPTPTEEPTPSPTPTGTPCANSLAFAGGSPIGFLIGLFETESGDQLGPEHAESVTVRFEAPDIDPLELTWDGKHAEYVDGRWGGKLADTGSFEPGTYQYDVVVSTPSGEEVVTTSQFVIV